MGATLERNVTVDQLMEQGYSFTDATKKLREHLVKKWLWLIEAKEFAPVAPALVDSMAVILENQSQHYRRKHVAMLEGSSTSDVTLPQRYALPIIRNVFPQLIASKICSIQPLPLSSGGVGNIYYLDHKYEDTGGTPSVTTADSDYSLSSESAIPNRLKVGITSDTITVHKDLLAATWTSEIQEDAEGAIGLNVEQSLVTECSNQILREMDARVLASILGGATAGDTTWEWTPDSGYTAKEWYETLFHAFIDAEDDIYGNRYRKADWIIAGRSVSKYLRKSQDFKPAPKADPYSGTLSAGVQFIGNHSGLWDVYTTPLINTNKAIMGVYPSSQVDTGFILAPYIPIEAMPLVYAGFNHSTGAYENKDEWTRNVRTRYGYKMVVGNLFATVTISAGS